MTPQEALAMINNSEKKEAAKAIETAKKKEVTNDTSEPVEKTTIPTPAIERPSLDNSLENELQVFLTYRFFAGTKHSET